jgi:two-component system, OmpR family, phosphate regulon response regulator PhoB
MSKPSVLIVEDNRDMQALLVDIMQVAGLEAQAIGRGDEALVRMLKEPPALVLLDVDLPGTLSGIDVLKAIRGDAILAVTKVILLTAQHVAARGPEAESADLVLLKPFEAEQLIVLSERLLNMLH